MIFDLKPYAEYKESGLLWLGQVPAHWEISRSKRLFTRRTELARPDDIQLSATQSYGVIPQSLYEERTGYRVVKISMHLDKRRHVEPDDFVISMRSFQGGLERAWSKGAIRSSYVVLKPDFQVNPNYFKYFFKSTPYIGALRATANFIRDGQDLNYENFRDVDLPLIEPTEQAAIARFLDWANAQLNRAIVAKRKVIALLNEQKQTIIHRAVTRGLDPCVPLKPSGIPWLGDIPRHWEVIPARHLFRSVTRRDIQGDEPKMSVTQKQGLVPTAEMQENSTQASSFDRFQLCHTNDLVLNKYKAHLGVFWAATRRGLITPNYTVFRPTRTLSTKFFEHLFHTQAYRDAFSMVVYGVIEGMCPLYTQDFYRIPCACPPHGEQVRIVDAVVGMTETEEAAISRLDREIDLLREYRTRLVADVVTGRLDVREAAARLPDEAPADTAEDDVELDEETEAADEGAAA